MSITNSREFTINVGKIAEAEKWLSEGADLWKEITGKDAVIYKEGWGDQYKMLFVTTYESMGGANSATMFSRWECVCPEISFKRNSMNYLVTLKVSKLI